MTAPDPSNPQAPAQRRPEPPGFMRWGRGLGLGCVLFALLLFSREQDEFGYAMLAVGWAILIYSIIIRSR